MAAESTALTVTSQPTMPEWMGSIYGQLEAAMPVAKVFASSDLVPKCYRDRPGDILIAAAMGQRLGIDLFTSLSGIAPINGRPQVWGDLVLALCQRNRDFMDCVEAYEGTPYEDAFTAVCVVTRKNRKPHTERFSVADAKRAGKWDDRPKVERKGQNGGTYQADNDSPWYRYPKRMLMARARGYALRHLFSDALQGIAIRELEDDVREVEATVVATDPPAARTAAAPATGAPSPQDAAPAATTKPAPAELVRARALWSELEQQSKGLGAAVIDRLCALHGAKAPKDIAQEKLAAFGKDVDELAKDHTRIDDLLATWATAAKEAAAEGGTK